MRSGTLCLLLVAGLAISSGADAAGDQAGGGQGQGQGEGLGLGLAGLGPAIAESIGQNIGQNIGKTLGRGIGQGLEFGQSLRERLSQGLQGLGGQQGQGQGPLGSLLGLGLGLGAPPAESTPPPAPAARQRQSSSSPRAGASKGTAFHFHSRSRRAVPHKVDVGDVNALESSGFSKRKPTKVIIHGFGGSLNNSMIQTMKDAYLSKMDVNVIAVDWSALSAVPWYSIARANVEPVGSTVAVLLDWLVEAGANMSSFHLVGHSLGAHVAGIAGSQVKKGRVPRISGLDPARPGFRDTPDSGKLDAQDALLVDVIHTTAGWYGMEDPIGHLDFYPNGGIYRQPGCDIDLYGRCSHAKSYTLFRESIKGFQFNAVGCNNMREAVRGTCSGQRGRMGEPATET